MQTRVPCAALLIDDEAPLTAMSEAVDYVALLTAVPSVLVV